MVESSLAQFLESPSLSLGHVMVKPTFNSTSKYYIFFDKGSLHRRVMVYFSLSTHSLLHMCVCAKGERGGSRG